MSDRSSFRIGASWVWSAALLSWFGFVAPSIALAASITIDVMCPPAGKVGAITVGNDGGGISGGFTSTVGGPPPTLKDAAIACGEDHFNWYQVRVGGGAPPPDAHGNVPTIPFIDPPPDGWNYGWADALPWYWDEYPPADGKNPDGTPYDPDYLTKNQTTADTLKFSDFPGGSDKVFHTWLVSLNADGSWHSWHEGFSWEWSNSTGAPLVSNIRALNGFPTDALYMDINGSFATSAPVPEPASVILMASGLLAFWRFRKRT